MLKSREDIAKLREDSSKILKQQKNKIYVCSGTGCMASGAGAVYDALLEVIKAKNIDCIVTLEHEPHEDSLAVKKSGCLGFCEMGPLIKMEPSGYLYIKVKPEDCDEIIEETVKNGKCIDRLLYKQEGKTYQKMEEIPFCNKQSLVVLEHSGHIDATSIKEYIAVGGYSALEKALFDITKDDVVKAMEDSGLRGRGGGGFPAGEKWMQVKKQPEGTKYIVCNGDEGDPGAFMDESIMEGDAHRLLEGMMLAGYACGSELGYIYVRAEYPLACARLENAIGEAREYGILGKNILGTDFNFDIRISKGAGAFVCGEGSALTASVEGKRGMPRVKPPRTYEKGLFEKPTVLNNVETFANAPMIVLNGADWFRKFGNEKSPGTKIFAITGNIQNTGLIEVPMGTKLRDVVFEIGGGIKNGKKLKAVQIGGPSGGCLTEKDMDMPLDFDSLQKVGAIVGSGGLVVMDEDTCMVDVARFFMSFTQKESCGKCVPCRQGTKRMLEIMNGIVEGRGKMEDLDLLLELGDTISKTSLCALGKTAPSPVISTIKNFRNEYETHIIEKRCPSKTCQSLKLILIDPELCIGCGKCKKVCPVDAIEGEKKEAHKIDEKKCIKCGACMEACPKSAVKED